MENGYLYAWKLISIFVGVYVLGGGSVLIHHLVRNKHFRKIHLPGAMILFTIATLITTFRSIYEWLDAWHWLVGFAYIGCAVGLWYKIKEETAEHYYNKYHKKTKDE